MSSSLAHEHISPLYVYDISAPPPLEYSSSRLALNSDICAQADATLQTTIDTSLLILRQFIPTKFLYNFTSPCWYADVNKELLSQLRGPFDLWDGVHKAYSSEEINQLSKLALMTKTGLTQKKLFCLPKFFIAGIAKCGTTALFDIVSKHQSIKPPHSKEVHFWKGFFRQDVTHSTRVLSALHYLLHFSPAVEGMLDDPHALTLDASPSAFLAATYRTFGEKSGMKLCEMPLTLSHVLPDSKFVVILRNPVQRTWSAFWYFCSAMKRWKSKGISQLYIEKGPVIFHNNVVDLIKLFQECLDNETSFILNCVNRVMSVKPVKDNRCSTGRIGIGLYYYHIAAWLSVFPRKQFLFLRMEDMKRDEEGTLKEVWEFLELEPPRHSYVADVFQEAYEKFKPAQYQNVIQMLPQTKELLEEFYRPFNEKLSGLLNDEKFLWNDSK